MDTKDLNDGLKQLGFTDKESKVFFALLTGKQMSASEVAKEAGIRRTDVYDILKTFVKKSYINEIETSSVLKFRIIDPKVVSEKIQNDIRVETNKIIHQTQNLFTDLQSLYKTSKIEKSKEENIELVRGYNRFRHIRFFELIENSKEEILMMNRLEGHVSKQADAVTEKFLKRGGAYKSIFEVSLNFKIQKENKWISVTIDDFIDLCRHYEKRREQIRLTKMLIANFTVFDREIVFLNIQDKSIPKHNKTDIIVRNKEFAQFIVNIFDLCWTQSFTVGEFAEISNLDKSKK
jgi:sugar-specific transcriptional regulator TrmB